MGGSQEEASAHEQKLKQISLHHLADSVTAAKLQDFLKAKGIHAKEVKINTPKPQGLANITFDNKADCNPSSLILHSGLSYQNSEAILSRRQENSNQSYLQWRL